MSTERVGWTIRFGEHTWRERDLTLGQAMQFQELTGLAWPGWPIDSALALASLLAVFLADGNPARLDDALAQAAAIPMVDALAMAAPGED